MRDSNEGERDSAARSGATASREAEAVTRGRRFGGIRLGRLADIELFADWSLFLIFMLVTFSLGNGVLRRWHPDWGAPLLWGVALSAAILFFLSILLHELSHALVGRANGVPVRRITLFVFGGIAHTEREPATPRAELLMAIVGPITSMVIGVGATLAGLALAGPAVQTGTITEDVARLIGPGATILLWLGPINFIIGLFNLVPGFPLDGGRVLRAVLWWTTGDLMKATRWAAGAGRAFGLALIASGVLMAFGFRIPFFGTGLAGGLWLVLIGWFLHNAARASYEQLVVRHHLAGVPVTHVMRSRLQTVTPAISVTELVDEYIMGTDPTSFPVVADGELVGTVEARHVRGVPAAEWPVVTVGEIMAPADAIESIDANAAASEALEKLASAGSDQLPVLEHGHLRGFVRRQDILKWLALQGEPVG